MAAPLASSIKTKNFSAKFQNILIFFSTYRRYFKHFFLLADRTSIGIECVIFFHRFSLMYTKYFTVYFRRTIELDARVANLILYYSNVINVLRNDNNVARVKSKRIETSICSIINIKLSKPIFGLPMYKQRCFDHRIGVITEVPLLCTTWHRFYTAHVLGPPPS